MKKNNFFLRVVLSIFVFTSTNAIAQTTLSPGDLMIYGLNSDDSTTNEISGEGSADEFAFVLLKDITAGTEVYFTDFGYLNSSSPFFQKNENNGCGSGTGGTSDGIIKWTADTGLTAGTKVLIRTGISINVASSGTVISVVETTVSGQSLSLSGGGETLHVFQGNVDGTGVVTAATMISSYRFKGQWETTMVECTNNTTRSHDPGTGFEFEMISNSPNDNSVYNGTFTGTVAEIQAKLLAPSNYTIQNSPALIIDTADAVLSNKNEVFLKKNTVVSPNPTRGIVNVSVMNGLTIQVLELYSLTGKLIISQKGKSIDIANLSSGLYFLQIKTNKGKLTSKVIKE